MRMSLSIPELKQVKIKHILKLSPGHENCIKKINILLTNYFHGLNLHAFSNVITSAILPKLWRFQIACNNLDFTSTTPFKYD